MRIMHVITGLNGGGAEGMLYRMIAEDQQNTHSVVSLMDGGVYGEPLTALGIQVFTLNMPRSKITWYGVRTLFALMRSMQPDVVQTWMPHANLLGGVIARFAGLKTVIWGIRGAYDKSRSSVPTRIVHWLSARLSNRTPRFIVSNSEHAKTTHMEFGYAAQKMRVIPNGFSFEKFRPDPFAKAKVMAEFSIMPNTVLLGMVARYDIYKDHENLFKALAQISNSNSSFTCLLVGAGMEPSNEPLMRLIRQYNMQNHVLLLGARQDIPCLMAALDLHILSSAGESFPNVLAEAMACGTPCVTTDVGDAARIVGNMGWVVPPFDAHAMSEAIGEAIEQLKNTEQWTTRKNACLNYVNTKFSLDSMIALYHFLWEEALSGRCTSD